MAIEEDRDPSNMDEQYDEEADSDFDGNATDDELISSSDEDARQEGNSEQSKNAKSRSKHAIDSTPLELDSGDEATINEQQRSKRKQKKKSGTNHRDSDNESDSWRAKTRAMRAQEKEENKKNKLASSKGSTIDVDKIWEAMNRPGPLPPLRMEDGFGNVIDDVEPSKVPSSSEQNKENIPAHHEEEMITIKRKFHFAGEVHEETKTVPKSSAEARLWLSQQDKVQPTQPEEHPLIQRPLRKVSRFDPNYNNLGAFRTNFIRNTAGTEPFKGPRLNVVEKSKMDWAAHVDAEGLKEELDVHAKAKEGYHSRMDFLGQVEQRKEEEARLARTVK